MPAKLILDYNKVYFLYIIKGLTTTETAQELGCSFSTICRFIKENNIKKDTKDIVKHREQTCLKKYGVKNPSQSDEIKQQKIETCLKNHGVEYSFQSKNCREKSKQTNLKKYGCEYSSQNANVKKKAKQTTLKRHGIENYRNIKKAKETCIKKYGIDNPSKVSEVKNKTRKTCLKKYGYENPMQNLQIKTKCRVNVKNSLLKKYGVECSTYIPGVSQKIAESWHKKTQDEIDVIINKQILTKKLNNTITTSSLEETIYSLLQTKFNNITRQYKESRYPFNCDFYIPDLDLFVEIQGIWTHGGKPFEGISKDLEKLNIWKEKAKTSKFYKIAIDVWTICDPLKRQTAKDNDLNWLEFFTLDEFLKWFNNI